MFQHVLLLLGITILAGLYVSKGVRKIRTPQVVGYVIAGVLLGPSLLKLYNTNVVEGLDILSTVALSFIGFTIGSELNIVNIRQLGKAIVCVLLAEAVGAFVLVGGGVYLITLITGSPSLPLATSRGSARGWRGWASTPPC